MSKSHGLRSRPSSAACSASDPSNLPKVITFVGQRSMQSWHRVHQLKPGDGISGDDYGIRVALSGDLAWCVADDGVARAYAFDLREQLVLSASPTTVMAGDTLALDTCGGTDGHLVALFAVDIGGTPLFWHLLTGSFLGTDLSYEDFQQLQGLAEHAEIARLPDAAVEGRPAYVLEGVTGNGAPSSYQRVRSWFDRESCVLLRAELTGPGLRREVEVAWADVERVGERYLPRRLTLRDLEKGSETRLSILETDWDPELPDSLFSETGLAKGH